MPRVTRLKLRDLELGDSQGIKFDCELDLFSVTFCESRPDRINRLPVAMRLYLIKMCREPWVLIRVSTAVTEYNNQKQLGERSGFISVDSSTPQFIMKGNPSKNSMQKHGETLTYGLLSLLSHTAQGPPA